MTWSKTPRILLVWPIRQRVNLRPLDLKLLQRHAAALGAQMGLVTTDAEIKATARALGIPTFKTSSQARKSGWQAAPRPGITRRISRESVFARRAQAHQADPLALRHPLWRLLFFGLGVLSVLAVVLIFVPAAEITLTPALDTQTLTLPVSAAADIDTVYLSGSMPMRTLTIQVEAEATRLSTGQTSIPDQPAQGQVTFAKIVFGPVSIPAGTVIRAADAGGMRFATLEPLNLPEGENQTGSVLVRALAPGARGNLPAGKLTAIEGGLGLLVTVTNPQPTTGGSDALRPTPSSSDVDLLRQQLLRRLAAQAQTNLRRQLLPNDLPFPETLTLVRILEENISPAPGEPAAFFTLHLRAEYQANYAAAADLDALARAALDAALPPGYVPLPETLQIHIVQQPVASSGGSVHWQMRVSRQMRTRIDRAGVIDLVRGQALETARQRLAATFRLANPPQIAIWPQSWRVLPYIPFRIEVR